MLQFTAPLIALALSSATQPPTALLTVEDAAPFSNYGASVAVSGDWAFVGAPDDAIGGSNYVGSVHAFERTAQGWQKRQKLIAPDGVLFNTFGHALAVDGDRLAVGAPDPLGDGIGAVYLFRRNGTVWEQEQKLQATTGWGNDWFGWSLDLQGERLVVGSMWSTQPGIGWGGNNTAGAAWVFNHQGGTWELEQQLSASDKDSYDLFGSAVAIDGNTIAVGARGEGDPVGFDVRAYIGAVYTFALEGGTWNETQKLRAADFEENAWFGESVALQLPWLLVGSPGKTGGGTHGLGVAYTFLDSGGTWQQTAKLESAHPGTSLTFGQALALDGDLAVIASSGYDLLGNHQGAVHPFRRSGSTWIAEPPLNPGDLGNWDLFGQGVDLDGTTLITGAYLESLPGSLAPGGGYLYDLAPRFHLMAKPLPLTVGEDGKLVLRFATPNAPAWIAYSLTGLGSTPAPPLGVTLDLANARALFPAAQTDAGGFVQWEMPVPAGARGENVWLQGVQAGQTTNVILSPIQ